MRTMGTTKNQPTYGRQRVARVGSVPRKTEGPEANPNDLSSVRSPSGNSTQYSGMTKRALTKKSMPSRLSIQGSSGLGTTSGASPAGRAVVVTLPSGVLDSWNHMPLWVVLFDMDTACFAGGTMCRAER